MAKNIYTIKLGESAYVGPIEFFRVPGGWIILTYQGPCFVPWNNEFQEKPNSSDSSSCGPG